VGYESLNNLNGSNNVVVKLVKLFCRDPVFPALTSPHLVYFISINVILYDLEAKYITGIP